MWAVAVLAGLVSASVTAAAETNLPSRSGLEPRRPRLELAWIDPTGAAPFAFLGMAAESARLVLGMDVDVEWSQVPAGDTLLGTFPVVLMVTSRPWTHGARHVMGASPRQGGPAVWVYLEEVALALGLEGRPPATWSAQQQRDLGVALGRVVAHELVHAVLPGRPHTHDGLMKAQMHRQMLVNGKLEADPDTGRAFHDALERAGKTTRALLASGALF